MNIVRFAFIVTLFCSIAIAQANGDQKETSDEAVEATVVEAAVVEEAEAVEAAVVEEAPVIEAEAVEAAVVEKAPATEAAEETVDPDGKAEKIE